MPGEPLPAEQIPMEPLSDRTVSPECQTDNIFS